MFSHRLEVVGEPGLEGVLVVDQHLAAAGGGLKWSSNDPQMVPNDPQVVPMTPNSPKSVTIPSNSYLAFTFITFAVWNVVGLPQQQRRLKQKSGSNI